MSALEVLQSNNVKAYQIANSSRSAIPEWLAQQKKKALKHDANWQKRVELIQDFEFPEASIRLCPTRDGQYILATGVYKPRVRVFDLAQMAMKFERHSDCENVQLEILSNDWTKFIMLQTDRSIEFHTPLGMHYRTRVPKFGRDMAYHYPSCDLLVGASGSEVYRLNLEQGRFLNPLQTESPGVNVTKINPAHQMWAFGGEDGFIEFWDHRQRSRIGRLNIGGAAVGTFNDDRYSSPEVTAIEFADDGLTYAVGTAGGQVAIYDIRSPIPRLTKDHQYGTPIKRINFHSSGNIISADQKIIKIWDRNSGNLYTSLEPDNEINDFCVFPQTGLLMTANEGQRMNIFYIPSMGPAPKWCSFLDNLTEELEENTANQNVYDDFKFVTKKELSELGLDHLIGTNLLKAYMHGYFVDLRLYEKAKSIANPFAYDDYKRKIVRAKLEEERKSRISAARKLPKVNRNMAKRLLAGGKKASMDEPVQPNGTATTTTAATTASINPLGDSRFAEIFVNPDFQVDEENPEYLKFNTAARINPTRDFERIDGDGEDSSSELEGRMSEEEDESLIGAGSDRDSDDDDQLLGKYRYKKKVSGERRSDGRNDRQASKKTLHALKPGRSWDQVLSQQSGGAHDDQQRTSNSRMSFSKRLNRGEANAKRRGNQSTRVSGAKTLNFKVSSLKKK